MVPKQVKLVQLSESRKGHTDNSQSIMIAHNNPLRRYKSRRFMNGMDPHLDAIVILKELRLSGPMKSGGRGGLLARAPVVILQSEEGYQVHFFFIYVASEKPCTIMLIS